MKLSGMTFRLLSMFLALCAMLTVSACMPTAQTPEPMADVQMEPSAAPMKRAKLGTQWGEGIGSTITVQDLKRKHSKPESVDVLAYAAFRASGEKIRELTLTNGRVGLRVLKDNGSAWPIFRIGGVERLQGRSGQRYTLEYRNYSRTKTYEVVATVDGLDVLNGQPGSLRNNGYILAPGKTLQIQGFRKDATEVAAFRFSSAADSYAANSKVGSIANVGVIGTAIFELIAPAPVRTLPTATACKRNPCAFPDDAGTGHPGYASPPVYDE
ncbi:hypothetical protein [Pseudorhodobacter sp.]|uniref:hypothetical protein n=1 Tax=Pseudorhodobacter sp. TaxID=1934400 RepID=UPI00264A067C|nr:hypothetical protein [Pseudorhodobacter sp.]MDN5786684.1 hypothetical protein [Pseudorhodobacter sp.]